MALVTKARKEKAGSCSLLFFFTGLIAIAIMQSSWWEAAAAVADAVLLRDFVNVICQFW